MRYDDRDGDGEFEPSEEPEHVDGELQTEAEATCPYCGEVVDLVLDAGGGTSQDYVQDCSVCCQPWRVRVEYDDSGSAQVSLEEAQ